MSPMRLQIDAERCQGHGRCYDLVPSLFGDDEEGYGKVLGDGAVSADDERDARLAVANCPERAIELRAVELRAVELRATELVEEN